jgi:hypothetical protein
MPAPRDRQVPEARGQYLCGLVCACVEAAIYRVSTHAQTSPHRVPAWNQEPKGRGSGALIFNEMTPYR